MLKLLWNLLALIGLIMVAAFIWLAFTFNFNLQNFKDFANLKNFDPKAGEVYVEMTKNLLASGNGAEATIWKVPVAKDLTAEDVEIAMKSVANERNFKNVGELPLSEQVAIMTGEDQRFWKIYMFCDPLTAAKMVDYSDAFSAYLPCRIALVEDNDGQLWLYTLNMDMMIHGGKELPDELYEEATNVKEIILEIMNRGAAGEF
jgi:uncharacterized protein (DUF302 family)